MYNDQQREHKRIRHEIRVGHYKTACFWATFGIMLPCFNFVGQIMLHITEYPKPIHTIYEGTYTRQVNPWQVDVYDSYDYIYETPADENKAVFIENFSYFLGTVLAILIAYGFYLLFVRVVEPFIFKSIDFNDKYDEKKAAVRRKTVIGLVVVLYCCLFVFMMEFDINATASNINNDTQQSDGLEELENMEDDEFDAIYNHEKEKATEIKETPVDRGYPSNELQYYIDHPNEPMPEEIINELLRPSEEEMEEIYRDMENYY